MQILVQKGKYWEPRATNWSVSASSRNSPRNGGLWAKAKCVINI